MSTCCNSIQIRNIRHERGWRRLLCPALVVTTALATCPLPFLAAQSSAPPAVPETLTIPEQWGRIIDRWSPVTDPQSTQHNPRLVIHIQDLHTHPDAQDKISRLIGHLHDQYGIDLVALEGAEGLCDTTLYSDLPHPESTERASRLFMHEGLFSGAEYYAITHPGEVTRWGVEDQALYDAHLRAYRMGYYPKLQLTAWLAHVQTTLTRAKRQHFSKPLRRLGQLKAQYEIGQIKFQQYFNRTAFTRRTA